MKEPQTFSEAYQNACAQSSLPRQVADLSRISSYKFLFMEIAREVCPQFVVREEYKPIFNDIVLYCLNAGGNLSPRKGLWIWGDIGTGKTTLLHIIRNYCALVRPVDSDGTTYGFCINNAIDVCSKFASKGYEGLSFYVTSERDDNISRQAFDELGSEARIMQHYGCVENVFQYILQRRYEKHDGINNITHVTTNLTPKQIADNYGPRIYDRCKEMFNFIAMMGKTFRK